MVVNKSGKAIANLGNPIKRFNSMAEYEAWKDALPEGLTEDDFFVFIQDYPEVGSFVRADTLAELESYPASMKRAGVLYGAVLERALYTFNEESMGFVRFVV